jgi:hypothetical protein
MLGIFIYIFMNKKNNHNNYNKDRCPIIREIQDVNVIRNIGEIRETSKEDIPIYPKKLPQYQNTEYQQIGILTANETEKEPIVLPLFAKKVRNNKERWQYYTATDKNNMMRLPITHQNMKCDEDIGCKEIYDGDKLSIEIYQGRVFTATIYKIEAPRYFADMY